MAKQFPQSEFEVWGGIECTCNRVGGNYFDQLKLTDHYSRPDDLEKIVSLGIKKIRYPILWEIHEPRPNCPIDWRWISGQLKFFELNNVTPIAGLVHHGSGPLYTNLADDFFAKGLAGYAARVAKQFPGLIYYTPVNEPLTTARFSGLYGVWYPHAQNDLAFIRMLLNQVKAIVLSMAAIREINADAQLIQTEDLAKTYSTPPLNYQAEFENERRWLTYDLLCGKVNKHHSLWGYLKWVGLQDREILFFEDNPCIPDIAGFNYYLTSERFLDHNFELYPSHTWGGNGKGRYADTEAVRVNHPFQWGIDVLLKEAWNRFRLPMAVTEVFLTCTPDEQVRWCYEVNQKVKQLVDNGLDIRAITFWALLGESGWNKLVTTDDGQYEPGAFDVGNNCNATALATLIESISGKDNKFKIPHLEEGWWSKSDRFIVDHIPCVA